MHCPKPLHFFYTHAILMCDCVENVWSVLVFWKIDVGTGWAQDAPLLPENGWSIIRIMEHPTKITYY